MRHRGGWGVFVAFVLVMVGVGCGSSTSHTDAGEDSSADARGIVEVPDGRGGDSTVADSTPADTTAPDTAMPDTTVSPMPDAEPDTSLPDTAPPEDTSSGNDAPAEGGGDASSEAEAAALTYTIGGTVSGLTAGASVMLEDNGTDTLTVGSNGTFTFTTPLPAGTAYAVTILTQPMGETCSVQAGQGTVSANVTGVVVTCVPLPMDAGQTFTVGGTVSGLQAGTSVVLEDNNANPLTVTANGNFTFPMALPAGAAYSVTIVTEPSGNICAILNGAGTVTGNVSNVTVSCVSAGGPYTLGGTVSGLAGGDTLELTATGGNQLFITRNGAFTFPTALSSGTMYAVTVASQPSIPVTETCTVTANGTGTIGSANVTNVTVVCAANAYTVGGTLSGLATGASVIVQDNGGNALTLTSNGAFTFTTPLASGDAYAVTVSQSPSYPPVQQTCAVTNGTGSVGTGNVTNIAVACTTVPYTVGGKIAGLASGSSVVLSDDGSFDTLVVTGNGAGSQGFTFGATIPSGGTYDVAVVSSPTAPVAQTCVISSGGGPGTVTNANIVNVSITCTTLTFTIEGTVSGIAAGATVSAVDNGDTADTQTLTPTTTNFAFAVQVASGQAYDVSLTLNSPPTAPDPQTCTVTGGSTGGGTGVVADSNVNLTVTCTCTNGVTIPAQCATGTDPETGAQWVTCGPSSCYQAWFSYTGGTGGTFHGTQICKSFGYPEMNEYGTADAVCDESPLAPDPTASCSTPGTENFNQTGYIGTDTHGPEVGGMVMWHCGPG